MFPKSYYVSNVFRIKIHFMPVIDFYNDLRNYHRKGTVDVYPAMMMLMIIMISCNVLVSNVSERKNVEVISTTTGVFFVSV